MNDAPSGYRIEQAVATFTPMTRSVRPGRASSRTIVPPHSVGGMPQVKRELEAVRTMRAAIFDDPIAWRCRIG